MLDAETTETTPSVGDMPLVGHAGDFRGLWDFRKSENASIATLTDIENAIYMRQ